MCYICFMARVFSIYLLVVALVASFTGAHASAATMAEFTDGGKWALVPLADGFDFPVGKPNGDGYYKARGLRLKSPRHLGED